MSKFSLSHEIINQIIEFNFFILDESWEDYLTIFSELQSLEIKVERMNQDPRSCQRIEKELIMILGENVIKKDLTNYYKKKKKYNSLLEENKNLKSKLKSKNKIIKNQQKEISDIKELYSKRQSNINNEEEKEKDDSDKDEENNNDKDNDNNMREQKDVLLKKAKNEFKLIKKNYNNKMEENNAFNNKNNINIMQYPGNQKLSIRNKYKTKKIKKIYK